MMEVFDLQFFADGADAGGTQEAEGTGAEQAGSSAPVKEGQPATDRERKSFRELIEGDYKDDYEKELKKVVGSRLKKSQGTEKELERYRKLDVALGLLSERYGISSENGLDLEKLEEAIRGDDELFMEQAAERGMAPDALRNQKMLEFENKSLKGQMQMAAERQRREAEYAQMKEASEELKGLYPEFELDKEMLNPKFGRLVAAGVDMRTAYEVAHRDEIAKATMEYSAKKASEALAANVAANRARPDENSVTGMPQVKFQSSPKDWTKEEREEIRRRVRKGEKVVF